MASTAPVASSSLKDCSSSKREGDLVRIIENDATLVMVQDFIKQQDGKTDLNERNKHGRTALMMACLHGKLEIVKYLLEIGADHHLTAPDIKNTALHFACMFMESNSEADSALKWEETAEGAKNPASGEAKGDGFEAHFDVKGDAIVLQLIVNLLLHKAEFQKNDDGLYPLDLAALNKRLGVFAFLGSKGLVGKSMLVRGLDILGYLLAVEDKHKDAARILGKAVMEMESDTGNPDPVEFTSDLETFLGQKECKTMADWKALKKTNHARKVNAFLVGDRVLPEKLKPKVLYGPLAKYGHELLFKMKTRAKGFLIFDACLHLERKGLFYLNTVLMYLRMSVPRAETLEIFRDAQFVNSTCKMLGKYIDVMKDVPIDHIEKSVKDIMCNLGRILFDVINEYQSLEILEQFLSPIIEMINVIWDRIPKPEATGSGILVPTISVCHNVLLHLGREFCPNIFFCAPHPSRTRRYTTFLFKRLIANLLHVEGALDLDCHGNTMIHTLMVYSQTLSPQLIVDIAKILIRHGCPTDAKNKKGETPYDINMEMRENEDDFDDEDDFEDEDGDEPCLQLDPRGMGIVYELLKGPEEVYSLQELAARSILSYRIPYRQKLPSTLCAIIRDPVLDEDYEAGDSETSSDYDSDDEQNCPIS
ncbi:uncharacterized protein LOC121427717 [Lytechinus variegatus]|uniref:uncharacterized protein LOC121427717 n=1 Tax=Lytechinus variegatus TaxID=7654 RepID=UPI001BB2B1FD|nr:uncharacterized protein LOC121427717 [Lytechinus variegatus]XP_041480182.1 uncharacterized protein LOC121427717 [Lytechinus variegatus]